ncbi:hypothetical protein G6F65_020424 [Rhizopus arrhizus]|nr:hypothetical protein G6F65_020424 [Rhizopus arrhizus]
MRRQVGPAHAGAPRQRVGRGAYGVHGIAVDDARLQPFAVRLRRHDAEIGTAMADVFQRVVRIQLVEFELHAAVQAVIARDHVAQQAHHHHRRTGHAHHSALQRAQPGHAAFRRAHRAQDLLGVGVEVGGAFAGRHIAGGPIEARRAHFGLKRGAQLADGGLGDDGGARRSAA